MYAEKQKSQKNQVHNFEEQSWKIDTIWLQDLL